MAKKIKFPTDKTARRRNLLMNVAHPLCKTVGKMFGMDEDRIDDYCSIPELIEISDRYNVKLRVVAGGTAARRAVYDHRPSFAIAVACERDMISGIREAIPLPIAGILNERPNGPCKNTKVDISLVEEMLARLIDGKR